MYTWPDSLPQHFGAEGFNIELPDNTLRSPMDSGPAKVRRITTANPGSMAGSMLMTTDQWDELRAFWRDTLRETYSFDFPNPEDDGATVLNVRFAKPPSKSFWRPGRWRVALAFEVLP